VNTLRPEKINPTRDCIYCAPSTEACGLAAGVPGSCSSQSPELSLAVLHMASALGSGFAQSSDYSRSVLAVVESKSTFALWMSPWRVLEQLTWAGG
jgi:hypothetical protein